MAGRVFSGIQPTGTLHLGNYFGAVRRWVELQAEAECLYCVVDYHALTAGLEGHLPDRVLALAGDLLACGIDPARAILFVQSHVPEHTELAWVLSCLTPHGELARMTQFKEKAEGRAGGGAGLFVYPALQAADILLYRATRVPVGEDQLQHLELARRAVRRFNAATGQTLFPEVEPVLGSGQRIMSLADPSRKMSKSLGAAHVIGLMEEAASIEAKLRAAVTDVGGQAGAAPGAGVANLLTLLELCAPVLAAEARAAQREGRLRYAELKAQLRDALLGVLAPLRARRAELGEEEVRRVLTEGAERARALAAETMREVRRLVGVGPAALRG